MTLAASELERALDRAGLGQQSSNAGKELLRGATATGGDGRGLGGTRPPGKEALGWGHTGTLGRHQGPWEGAEVLGMALGPSRKYWDPQDFTTALLKPP